MVGPAAMSALAPLRRSWSERVRRRRRRRAIDTAADVDTRHHGRSLGESLLDLDELAVGDPEHDRIRLRRALFVENEDECPPASFGRAISLSSSAASRSPGRGGAARGGARAGAWAT